MEFSFVDRIIDLETGKRARGRFVVPHRLSAFPPWLVAEAIGQLAAWVAMAKSEFRKRPVAALAGEVRVDGAATPGATIDLSVEIERCDDHAVLYGGSARVNGGPIVELQRCLGPMLRMEEFDSPAAMRERFAQLRSSGAPERDLASAAAPSLTVVTIERTPGQSVHAELRVPEWAPFFADHFPRRPVFPATLLLGMQSRLAVELAGEVLPAGTAPASQSLRVRNAKVRAFTVPGQVLEIGARVRDVHAAVVRLAVYARSDGKRVASALVEVRGRHSP